MSIYEKLKAWKIPSRELPNDEREVVILYTIGENDQPVIASAVYFSEVGWVLTENDDENITVQAWRDKT